MNFAIRIVGAAIGASVLAAATAAPLRAQTAGDARHPCVHALVAVEDTIDSARARAGDVFRFRIVDAVTAPDGTVVPAGQLGYGVVANASHAERGGRGGYLALETRFFVLPSGAHVPVMIDRFNDEASTVAGATANAPGVLGLIPIVGYAVGGYDSLHHGKDATIPRGTRVGTFIGDDSALGTCRPLAAGETMPPATPAPAVAPPATQAVPAGSSGAAPAGSVPAVPPSPPAPAPAAASASPAPR